MPDGVEKIEIWQNQELVFFLNDGTQIPLKSRVNITTNQECTEQTERCHYNFKKTLYTQGLKYITIESKGDYVIIGEADLTEVCNGVDDDYDDLVDEDFTNENCQPKCEYNGYTWAGNGGDLNCCGNDANEDSPYRLNEKVPDDYCADGNDNDCDGLTDAWDPDCFACTPLIETRPCSEQEGVCFGSFETCTAGGTWPGCSASNYGSDYESPETSCDGLDNDCDGLTDEGLTTTYYQDFDSDNYGNPAVSQEACTQPAGYVLDNTDCNDNNININPGKTEVCDGIDNDCNAGTLDGSGESAPLNSKQAGVCAGSTKSCIAGSWQDNYGGVANYEAPETSCDGLDNDCDGLTDEGLTTTYYQDFDSDNYGNPAVSQEACTKPAGYVLDNTDCNDNNININPGKTEVCDGIDNDCNPGTPDGSGEAAPFNSDQDGVCLGSKKSCSGVGGWVDDYTGVANYEPTETICYDGLDNDCDALTDCDDIVNCEGSICTADGANICVDGPYGPDCVGAYG